MNCEQKYNEALERARKEYKTHESFNGFREMLLRIFPELEESDDNERIRKKLLKMFNDMERDETILDDYGLDKLKTITWLEKQGESVEINPTEFDTRLQGTYQTPDEIIEECHQDNADRIIDIVTEHGKSSEWNEVDENECNHILKILNLVAEEQETKGYNNLISSANWLKSIKDRIQSKQTNKPQGKSALEAVKEEKVDNANKVEPKFKVGDWVVRKDGGVFFNNRKFAQITEIDGEKYWFDTGLIYLKAEDMRLWTLEDAKDGDILYSKKHNLLWRYKNTKECYFCMNLNYNSNNISKGDVIVIPNDVKPASKEQRDLLLDKILKQGQHNPTDNGDKVEPKFKVGDWIVVRGEVILICDIRNDLYDVIFADGEHRVYDTNILDKEAHLWTIADAKDGDVLVASDGSIFIFAGVVDDACKYYAALPLYNGVSINKEVEFGFWELSYAVHPATKEQCDLLFAKMREKGYKWNNEKKEVIRRI